MVFLAMFLNGSFEVELEAEIALGAALTGVIGLGAEGTAAADITGIAVFISSLADIADLVIGAFSFSFRLVVGREMG